MNTDSLKRIRNIFEDDIDDMPNDVRLMSLKFAIENNNLFVYENLTQIINNFNLQAHNLKCFEIEIKDKKDTYIKKQYPKFYSKYSYSDDVLFLKKLYEILYMDIYQSFEVYISNIYKSIFWFKPDLLDKKDFVTFNKYIGKNKIIEREKLLERVCKNIMMKGNIIDIINRLYEIIDEPINIGEEEFKCLFLCSQNRNLIVHNLGVVNNLYLVILRDNKIPCKYKVGDYIFEGVYNKNVIETNEISDFILEICDKIKESVNKYIDKLIN